MFPAERRTNHAWFIAGLSTLLLAVVATVARQPRWTTGGLLLLALCAAFVLRLVRPFPVAVIGVVVQEIKSPGPTLIVQRQARYNMRTSWEGSALALEQPVELAVVWHEGDRLPALWFHLVKVGEPLLLTEVRRGLLPVRRWRWQPATAAAPLVEFALSRQAEPAGPATARR